MKNKTFVYAVAVASLLVATLSSGLFASAQVGSNSVTVPSSAYSDGYLRIIQNGSVVIRSGDVISLGSARPEGDPGSTVPPLPKFSGINTPLLVSQDGPVHVGDDVVILGLTDARLGITNKKQEENVDADADPQEVVPNYPVRIYDDLVVSGNGAREPGNVTISGTLTAGPVNVGTVGGLSQITGNVRIIGGNVTVGGEATITGRTIQQGPLIVGRAEAKQNLTVWGTVFADSVRATAATVLEGTVTISGDTVFTRNVDFGSAQVPIDVDVFGTLTASQIGSFAESTSQVVSTSAVGSATSWVSVVRQCAANTVLVRCTPEISLAGGGLPTDGSWFTTAGAGVCRVFARRTSSNAPHFNASARALCFNPNSSQ